MAASMDSGPMRELAADLGLVQTTMVPKVRAVVSKGALNVKNQHRADLEKSSSFKQVAKTISYDVTVFKRHIDAEIGPNKRYRSGRLANIAYFEAESHSRAVFGTSTSGGVVPDPSVALEDEMPRLLSALGDVALRAIDR